MSARSASVRQRRLPPCGGAKQRGGRARSADRPRRTCARSNLAPRGRRLARGAPATGDRRAPPASRACLSERSFRPARRTHTAAACPHALTHGRAGRAPRRVHRQERPRRQLVPIRRVVELARARKDAEADSRAAAAARPRAAREPLQAPEEQPRRLARKEAEPTPGEVRRRRAASPAFEIRTRSHAAPRLPSPF